MAANKQLNSWTAAVVMIALGWVIHFMMGIIFAIIYAALWSSGIGSATVISGLIFGIVHWLVVGLMMGGMPMMHAGIKLSRPRTYLCSATAA